MENVQQLCEAESPLLMKPWAMKRNMYSNESGSSSIMPCSMTPNSMLLGSNHIPVRLVRWPHISQYMRPRFVNPQRFNQANYQAVHDMLPLYPYSHLMGSSIMPQTSEPSPDGLRELNPNTTENSNLLLNNEESLQNIQPTIDCTNEKTNEENDVYSVNDLFNGNSKSSDGEELLKELTKEYQDSPDKDLDLPLNLINSTDESNVSENMCALNDIAYEIEVETNIEQDLLNEVLSENYSEESDDSEKITFNTIEEVLTAIDDTKQSQEYSLPFELTGENSRLNIKMGPGVQEEVVKAAKSLFSKRTRTLYHWLYPDTSKTKLKATVTTAWDTLPENEKHFYMSQVLGRFGLQAGNLMINPQLDGMKGLSAESIIHSEKAAQQKINIGDDLETDQAVDDLLASCGETDCWLSYSSTANENNRKRKRDDSEVSLPYSSHGKSLSQESSSLTKQLKEISDGKTGFEDDTELNNELMKFQIFNDIENMSTNNNSVWQ